ncbi:PQQ-binding-like beta-propeller repeat protein [Saccharothrix sp. HUAS TT1]|uniref:outer membrane protein assembly factor BamB family protein n=1 Tax=unclassified Saccharothrix TaxID=2593673 RepID=UPI00345C1998
MLRWLALVGALCAGCAPWLSGGAPRPEADVTVIAAAAGVVLAALAAATGPRWVRVVAAVAAVALAGVVGRLLGLDLTTGLTGDDLPVLAVGSAAVAVAATGLARQAAGARQVRPAGALALVVVIAAAAAVAPTAADAAVTRSETRDARDFAPEPVAERPGHRQWAWQPDTDVVDVVPAGHGVAVATRDGSVVALNGLDGRQEWRYARPGAVVGSLAASVDRRTVLVSFGSLRDTRAQAAVLLDADTGSPRFELVVRSVLVQTDQLLPVGRVLAVRDDDVITGYDLADGRHRWRWTPPPGCTSRFGQVARGRTTVLVPLECPDTLSVTALDEATGEQRWRHETPRGPARDEQQEVRLRATPDGAIVHVQTIGARTPTDGLLDTATGRVLSRPDRPWTVRTDPGPTPLLEEQEGNRATTTHALHPTTGATTPLSAEACPGRTADLTTTAHYLRACADNGRELTVVTQPLDGSPPTSTPVRLDGSGSRSADVLLIAAPGAIVLARTASGGTPAPVVGLTG